jgi:hypothetical protein
MPAAAGAGRRQSRGAIAPRRRGVVAQDQAAEQATGESGIGQRTPAVQVRTPRWADTPRPQAARRAMRIAGSPFATCTGSAESNHAPSRRPPAASLPLLPPRWTGRLPVPVIQSASRSHQKRYYLYTVVPSCTHALPPDTASALSCSAMAPVYGCSTRAPRARAAAQAWGGSEGVAS